MALNKKIVILSKGKLIGPFENQQLAQTWLANHDDVRDSCEIYSLWETQPATAEQAQECGERIAAAA